MFQSGKLRNHLTNQKICYLIILALFILGFFIGGFYANLAEQDAFSEALNLANRFIESSKQSTPDIRLLFSEEITPYLFIFLSSLWLAGLPVMIFFVFKSGFSFGFFLTFLIKAFGLKGFFLGGLFLLIQIVCLLPALLVVSCRCYYTNRFLLCAITHRLSPKQSVKTELLLLISAFMLGSLMVLLAVTLKAFLLPILCRYLFL